MSGGMMVPLIAFGACAMPLITLWLVLDRVLVRRLRRARHDEQICTSCLYDLRGLAANANRCPECGTSLQSDGFDEEILVPRIPGGGD